MPYTANKKIAGLDPATTPLAAANEVPLNQAGTTVRASLTAIEAKVFDAKTALTPVAGETAVAIVRQTDGSLRQVALNDIVPPLNITDAKVAAGAAIVDTKLATIATAGKVSNSATTATSANTANAIVARDASGNFAAGTITATLSGGVVGNVTGNVSGTSGSTTGNAATATTLQTARTIAISGDVTGTATSFNGSANIAIAAAITADTIVNADVNSGAAILGTKITPAFGSQNISTTGTLAAGATTVTGTCAATAFSGPLTGNASTATTLATARDLSLTGDVTATLSSFNGSANVSAAATLANSGVAAGTYNNNAAQVRPFTVDAKGRVTAVGTAVPISVDYSAVTGMPYKGAARLATTANLTATYANGTAGVGATLTNNGTLGALSIDGAAVAANDRILVKDQTSAAHNGIYTVTNTGSAVAAWVLTRVTDADTNAELGSAVVTVTSGTANGGRVYMTFFKATDTVGTTVMPWYLVLTGGPSIITTSMLNDGAVTEAKIDPNAKIRGATGGGTDRVFYENDQTVNTNYTINTNKNAMSAGPITVANGITVTVPNGSTWTIV
jgi:hypothetical protein